MRKWKEGRRRLGCHSALFRNRPHEAPPPRQPGTRGRPRRKGKRLPSLVERLRDAATPWQSLRVRWYDGRVRRLQISSGTALWYRSGQPVLPLRWVLVRPCDAQHPPRAFFSTCPGDRAGDIVASFIKRWSIETTFEERPLSSNGAENCFKPCYSSCRGSRRGRNWPCATASGSTKACRP